MKLKVFYSPKSIANTRSFSPSATKPEAVAKDWQQLDVAITKPKALKTKDLMLAHDREFVRNVLNGEEQNGFGDFDIDVANTLVWTCGAMFSAAKHAIVFSETVTAALCSGFHHAGYRWNGGFCTLNGLMIAAIKLRTEGYARIVGILDLDQHYGNGTDDIINALNIDYVVHESHEVREQNAEKYLNSLSQIIKKRFKNCDVVLYQAGADSHINDPLGGAFTTEQLQRRDQIVFSTLAKMGVPVAFNLAGGYQKEADGSIPKVLEIHRNTAIEAIKTIKETSIKMARLDKVWKINPFDEVVDRRIHSRQIRFSNEEMVALDNFRKIIQQDTGVKPTFAWIISELLSLGIKEFERKYAYHEDLIEEENQPLIK